MKIGNAVVVLPGAIHFIDMLAQDNKVRIKGNAGQEYAISVSIISSETVCM